MNLSAKQSKAIAALLEEKTVKDAAEKAHVAEATIFRWLQDEQFRRTFREAKRRIVDQAILRLQKASNQAVETLTQIMTDTKKPPSSRVTAARIILDFATKAVEIEDLTNRIELLEAKINH